jgi:hypothetical protein
MNGLSEMTLTPLKTGSGVQFSDFPLQNGLLLSQLTGDAVAHRR